jgi:hypothetical protein
MGKLYRHVGKAYEVPDPERSNVVTLRIVQFKDNDSVAIEWAAMDYSKVLERWKSFRKKSPRPSTVAEARTLIKDFKKLELKRETTDTG